MKNFLLDEIYKPYLVQDANFDGKYEFPIVRSTNIKLPKDIVPFEKRSKIKNKKDVYLHFYMEDGQKRKVLNFVF